MSNLKAIKIESHIGYGECDDCGYYDWGEHIAKFPDGTELEYSWDNHLGGGSKEVFRTKILEHLGYRIEEEVTYKEDS